MDIWDNLFGTEEGQVTYTQNTQSNIPNQGAAIQNAIDEASRLYNQGPADYYGGQSIADLSPDTLNAMSMIRDRATAGSPLLGAAQDETLKTIQGGYLAGGNPYLDDAIQAGFNKARTGIDSQFGADGRYGGGLHKIGLGEAFGNIAAPLYAKAYETERDRMGVANALAPSMALADYADAGQLANVGAIDTQQRQDVINADIAKWNYNRNAPQDMLTNYLNAISGNYGQTSTTTNPIYTNNTANTLGTAIGGVGLVDNIFGQGTTGGLLSDAWGGVKSFFGG